LGKFDVNFYQASDDEDALCMKATGIRNRSCDKFYWAKTVVSSPLKKLPVHLRLRQGYL